MPKLRFAGSKCQDASTILEDVLTLKAPLPSLLQAKVYLNQLFNMSPIQKKIKQSNIK